MKFVLIILFSCVWLLAVGQQEEKVVTEEEEAMFFTPVSYMPIFGSCIDDSLSYREMEKCSGKSFVYFFYSHLNLPKVLLDETSKKRIIVQFTIQKDGSIANVRFLRRKILKKYENEIERVLQLMPCWRPGTMMGKPLDIMYTFVVQKPKNIIPKRVKIEERVICSVPNAPVLEGCRLDSLDNQKQRECTHAKLYELFAKNLKWPQRTHCYEGMILIQWTVEKDGNISDLKFLRDTPRYWEKEILRILQKMPKWAPAERNGVPIRRNYIFPLKILLEG